MSFTYAVIGCGKPWKTEGATGFGMSHQHAIGFKRAGAKLVALADINEANARAFKDRHGEPGGPDVRIFTDYRKMLTEVRPDIVSVCTWPALHTEMTLAAIEAGVRAVHCEKPMALTYGESRRMHEAATARGCQLTFNHQRRFNAPFMTARKMLREGVIGKVRSFEVVCGNLYDWGTHWLDMINFLNEESPAEWLIGQIDLRGKSEVFGAPIEGQGLAYIKFNNSIRATMITGYQRPEQAEFIVSGLDGTLEIEPKGCGNNHIRYRTAATRGGWVFVASEEGIHGDDAIHRGCQDVVTCLETGQEPELSSRKALQATGLIFATYESSRSGGRVDFPLRIDDSPLADRIARAAM